MNVNYILSITFQIIELVLIWYLKKRRKAAIQCQQSRECWGDNPTVSDMSAGTGLAVPAGQQQGWAGLCQYSKQSFDLITA